jgi:hypothetical protein
MRRAPHNAQHAADSTQPPWPLLSGARLRRLPAAELIGSFVRPAQRSAAVYSGRCPLTASHCEPQQRSEPLVRSAAAKALRRVTARLRRLVYDRSAHDRLCPALLCSALHCTALLCTALQVQRWNRSAHPAGQGAAVLITAHPHVPACAPACAPACERACARACVLPCTLLSAPSRVH